MKGYEIWNSDFIRAKRNGLPLVDKSGFIRELVELNVSVYRIIRPSGFGKTMNLLLNSLKNDEHPHMAILMGTCKVTGGLQLSYVNFDDFDHQSRYLDKWFGSTENEVSEVLANTDGIVD